jgi:hypothetical protein
MAKHAGGRPRKEIDFKQLEELCSIQCTEAEICSILDVDDKTLTLRIMETYGVSFSEYFAQKRGNGKTSLRRAQYLTAVGREPVLSEKGELLVPGTPPSPALLIWLGKNWLDQKDKSEISGPDNGPIYLSVEDRKERMAMLLAKVKDADGKRGK